MPPRVRVSPRLLLYPPVALLKFAIEVVCGRGFGYLSSFFAWLNAGSKKHLWRVLLVARRWTLGRPVWTVEDTLQDPLFQPFTNRQREIARADGRLRHITCPCGSKSCDAPNGVFVMAPPAALVRLDELIRSELGKIAPDAEITIDHLPPQ